MTFSVLNLKKSDMRYFDLAVKEAMQSPFPRFHVGCVVVYKGHVISSAHNTNKSDTVQKKYNKYRRFNNENSSKMINHAAHAEIKALKKIPYPMSIQIDWKKVKIYVARVAPGLPRGYGMSRPCPGCMAYIKELGIREIYYTTDMGYAGERIIYED